MAERGYLVLSAVGPDRPGLVAALTAAAAGRGVSVEDSRMAQLGGSFGVMMLLTGSPAALQALAAEGARLEATTGLRIHLAPTTPPTGGGPARRYRVEVEAADRAGIVHAISAALLDLGANIVQATSALYPAPHSGSPLFRLELVADLPTEVDEALLAGQLDRLAIEENLDCRVAPV